MPQMATPPIEVDGAIIGWATHRSWDAEGEFMDFETLPAALEYIITHGLNSCSLEAVVEVTMLTLSLRVEVPISKDILLRFARSTWEAPE